MTPTPHSPPSPNNAASAHNLGDASNTGATTSADIISFPERHGGSAPDSHPIKANPSNGQALARLWQVECTKRGIKVMNVTAKQMAQLKMVAKIGGGPNFIARIVRRWDKFTTIARDDMNAFPCPNEPHIGFMLQYANAGAKLTDEVEGIMYDPAAAKPKAKPVQTTAPSKPSKADAKMATMADLQAMLEEDGEADLLKAGVA